MIRGERLERFLLLPFSIGCDSKSSVALASTTRHSPKRTREMKGEEDKSKMKKNEGVTTRASIFSQGLQRLIRSFKSFTQFFVYKEEMGQMEMEMEIGFPTDVKHVTHIGLDGSTTINNNLKATELLSFPSISLQQFELAMAAQSHA